MEKDRNYPCFEKRIGAIRLTIFENKGENGKNWHNISITRSYRSGAEWKEATTFNGEGDLAQVAWAVSSALDWLKNHPNGQSLSGNNNE